MIFVGILKEYFEIEYTPLQTEMKVAFDIERIIKDFVFLFFFIGNDFLPRCMAYNIRQTSIEDLIDAFKEFLKTTEDYVVGP
jgi:5'-3' exonuclease